MNAFDSLPALIRRWYVVAGAALACALIGLVAALGIVKPVYTAEASVIINTAPGSDGSGATYDDVLMNAKLVKTYSYLLLSDRVLEQAAEKAGVARTTPVLRDEVGVSGMGDTEILLIRVTDPDPKAAADLCNAVADIASDGLFIQNKSVELTKVDPAPVPKSPSSPDPVKYTALGLLAGLLGSSVVLVILHYADNTIHTEEDLKACGISLLAVIPKDGRAAARPGAYGRT